MNGCIFCQILAGRGEASFVYRDERCAAFMDIQPVNPGHVLIIPNRHATCLADLAPEDGAHMMRVAQDIAAAIRRSDVRSEGVNLFLADGEAAGQEVFHVHLHLIPRYIDDGFGFTFPKRYFTSLPSRNELDSIAQSINTQLNQ